MEKPFLAYQGNDPYVFVCYDHDDAESVYREIAWLNNHAFRGAGLPGGFHEGAAEIYRRM